MDLQLGNGDFQVYSRIYSNVTIAQADLNDPKAAPMEIDRVLKACFVESRPVYITLPTDMVTLEVDAKLLDTSIDVDFHRSDQSAEDMALKIILDRLYGAVKPALLVDGATERRRV